MTMTSANKILITFLSSVAVAFTVGCSPVKTLNVLIPSHGYTLIHGIAYGTLPRQMLDVYIPKDKSLTAKPVVVFFYGGSWDSGDRSDYKFVAEALTSRGFVVVIPDYRLFPEVVFPEFVFDAAKAARWVKDNAKNYKGDPNKVFLVGHSAGAHIAAMLTLDQQYLASVDLKPKDFSGMIGLAGPYDFLPVKTDRLRTILGPEGQRWKSQPIHFVTGDNPPTLLMVGLKDDTVWPRNTFNLAAKIKEAGGSVEVLQYPNYSHVEMVAKLAKPFRKKDDLLDAIAHFIESHAITITPN
jgi:acetyl esterase/lipase